ncbi:MAG: SGNH/GDSL hydrolase family protein [Planctomycetes bacterium]|nr:SGNH/GDSL hydrolase family protein [Planctomycetota bacterium]
MSSLPRLIALGASNLSMSLPTLLRTARAQSGGATDVLAAPGFGRSYGVATRFLGRELPAITSCGIWSALERASEGADRERTTAVLMDVGNDILYGTRPDQVLQWVDRALHRLQPHAHERVLAGLPPTIERIGPLRFAVLRRVLVPGCRLELDEARQRARELQRGLLALAERHGARFCPYREAWFGPDGIHFKRRRRPEACAALLGGEVGLAPLPLRARVALRRARPEHRLRFGREQRHAQPALRLADGSTVAVY